MNNNYFQVEETEVVVLCGSGIENGGQRRVEYWRTHVAAIVASPETMVRLLI